jgi:predicted AlkP superfamily pyrophosphatase or phosphodiesterase
LTVLFSRLASLVCLGCIASLAPAVDPPPPKLVVLIYFDQLRGDYLSRWKDQFGGGGFRRLTGEGAWYTNCHYPYAYTVTGAGHASVATGCSPDLHGVVGNDWYDREFNKSVNCVGSDRHAQVPPKTAIDPDEDEKKITRAGVSPERNKKPTVGDAFKAASGGKSKVVSFSAKNRGAALPAGQTADAVYWIDGGTGQFVTSSYYRESPHPWVAAFNAAKPADRWKGQRWERFRTDLDYKALSGIDDQNGEGKGAAGQGRVFPHPFVPTDGKTKPAYYTAVYTSPFANELLLDLAVASISAEGLGADDTPDLLSISFSSNDSVGHAWGPDSQEVLDITLRSDAIIKRLLTVLDEKVGAGRYVVALSADHGVCPLVEVSKAKGLDAARVQPMSGTKTEAFLVEKFGKRPTKWLEAISGPWVYVNEKTAKDAKVPVAEVERALADYFAKLPGVAAAFTRSQYTAPATPGENPFLTQVRRSYYPGRCGDVYVLLKPYHLPSAALGTGTTHGTPYEYDTHVPLVVFGQGVKPGVRTERVTPLAAAPILAKAARVPLPTAAVPVPEGLFR